MKLNIFDEDKQHVLLTEEYNEYMSIFLNSTECRIVEEILILKKSDGSIDYICNELGLNPKEPSSIKTVEEYLEILMNVDRVALVNGRCKAIKVDLYISEENISRDEMIHLNRNFNVLKGKG